MSGPLLDRIDIHVEAPAVGIVQLREQAEGESSANIRTRVEKVRTLQRQRYQSEKTCNARMTPKQLRENCALGAAEEKLLVAAMNKLGLSARAHDKILKVARTIADMTESEKIESQHLMEAIGYRSLDRQKAV